MKKITKEVVVGKRYKVKDLRIVMWNKTEIERTMKNNGVMYRADVKEDEQIIGVYDSPQRFEQILLVAKLEEEHD